MSYKKVNQTDDVIISKIVNKKGYLLDAAPNKDVGMLRISLKELFDTDYGSRHSYQDDSFFMCGKHVEKTYRYQITDCQGDAKDQYSFGLIPIDIDIRDMDGRTTWDDTGKDPATYLKIITEKSPTIAKRASVVVTSRGGIRIVFVLDRYVNALEWRFLYQNTVSLIAEELEGEFGKFNKMKFFLDDIECVLDGRNPGSLTRVPFGYRDGKPTVDSTYFHCEINNFRYLPINTFGDLKEMENHQQERDGYRVMNLSIPRPEKRVPLPDFLKPYRWPDGEIPVSGEREIAMFKAVSRAKYKYTDRLTPEQYFSYFYDAVMQLETNDAVIHPLDMLWIKITRNYYVRDEAATDTGKKLDSRQLKNSGGLSFYPAGNFDNVLKPSQLYSYAKEEQNRVIKRLLTLEDRTVFLNPPPGAGKSTAAVTLLEQKGGIYIAPSNKQIKDISKKLQKRYNICLSYKELIDYICTEESTRIILHGKYEEYNRQYKNAYENAYRLNEGDPSAVFDRAMIIKNRTFYRVKSFPQFIEDQYPIESSLIHKENHARIARLTRGELTLLTKDKFLTLMGKETIHNLDEDHLIIYDEAEPEDIIDPSIYCGSDPVNVYGSEYQPIIEHDPRQERFVEYLKKRPVVFINANRGLDQALRHNGFEDVVTYGADMRPVIDNDLHVVISPDLKAGFSEYRNEADHTETSPRALYAAQCNPNVYTLMTNGRDVKGTPLSSDNLKRVIGSNDYINSKVLSIITSPTPEQIAELSFCTGLKPASAKHLLFENLVNQVISRNVGYRGHAITNEISVRDLHGVRAEHRNEHILVLPEAILEYDIDLIVKTTNVWTRKSKKLPPQVKPYLHAIPLECKTRAALYNVEPGTHSTLVQVAKVTGATAKNVSFVLKELKEDPMLSDFNLVSRKRIGTKTLRNVIQRFETQNVLLRKTFKEISNNFKFMDFIRLLSEKTSSKYINSLCKKDLKQLIKQEAFRYDFRVVNKDDVEYLVRTGAEELFFT